MPGNNENIIELIKKCFALSGSPNEHEAARAMEKAQELLEKYNLSLADVAVRVKSEIIRQYYNVLGRFLWRKMLVVYIAQRNFCQGYMISGRAGRDVVLIIGREVNVAATVEMVNWILPQVERLGRQAARQHNPREDFEGEGCVSKQRFRNSFCLGLVTRVNNRLYEAQQERAACNVNTKALVVNLRAEVDDWVKENLSMGRGGQGARNESWGGYSAGRSAGDSVSLRKASKLKGGN